MIESLKAEKFSALAGIRHGFFTRLGGVSDGKYASLNGGLSSEDDPQAVAENRRRIAMEVGVRPACLLSCHQVHSADVVVVDKPWQVAERPNADGMVTKVPGIALGILTGDCGPLLFADPVAKVIGGAHAGWKGALNNIMESTITAMEGLGAKRNQIHAVIGPCIWQETYEVGPDFPAPFLEKDPAHAAFFTKSAKVGSFMFDLPGFIKAKLNGAGLASVTASLANTYADERRFFSYRRNTHQGVTGTGSLVSALMLVE